MFDQRHKVTFYHFNSFKMCITRKKKKKEQIKGVDRAYFYTYSLIKCKIRHYIDIYKGIKTH